MLHVVRHYSQSIVQGSSTNQYVEVAYFFVKGLLLLLQSAANLCIFLKNVTDGRIYFSMMTVNP